MLVQTHYPRKLSRSRYDQYLASGWFRGAVMLYKMDLLCIDDEVYSVVNIRLNIEKFKLRKSQRKVLNKAEKRFHIVFGKATPNPEKEKLYQDHKHRFKGFIHGSLEEYLNAGYHSTVFDTREVCIYDGDKLIAVSYFDLGDRGMASLLCLYDESYKSWSLGKVTMLKEIEFGIETGRKWYYPGYVLDLPSNFDYKLELGKMEYYTRSRRWSDYSNFDLRTTSGHAVRTQTESLSMLLKEERIDHKKWLYPYFSMGYVGPWNGFLLRAPALIELGQDFKGKIVVSYSVEHNAYSLYRTHLYPEGAQILTMEASIEFSESDIYLSDLYQVGSIVVEHGSLELVLDQIKIIIKQPDFIPTI
jgi:arginyl-tRNA--protein-N-Asp/Glu arginylyltransferase